MAAVTSIAAARVASPPYSAARASCAPATSRMNAAARDASAAGGMHAGVTVGL